VMRVRLNEGAYDTSGVAVEPARHTALAGVAGAWLGWPALVAAGIAPLLIAVLPCLVMCALGLCIMKGGRGACDTQSTGQAASDTTADEPRQRESAQ